MNHLIELIDAHKHAYGVSDAELARRIGVSRQNLNLWRTHGLRGLPAKPTLDGIAAVTGQPYLTVLEAVLRDTGYLDDQDADASARQPRKRSGSHNLGK